MTRPTVTILSLSHIPSDGRVLRQIESAARDYDVTVVGWGRLAPRPHVRAFTVERWVFPPAQRLVQAALMLGGRLLPSLWERWYWRKPDHRAAYRLLREHPTDLVHVNEAIALPIALRAAADTGAKVLFDAHEYTPEQRANVLWWRVFSQAYYVELLRSSAPRVDAMTTVAPGIADRYRAELGLDVGVVLNAPDYVATRFRPVDPERIRLSHHGIALPGRHLENLVDIVAACDRRFVLHLMLIDTQDYVARLRGYAETVAPGRVAFHNPVPPDRIVEAISTHDVGLHYIPPVTFSYAHALPNKFFESIMAGHAIAIGPSVEMASYVHARKLGVVAGTYSPLELARLLNALTADGANAMKRRSLAAATDLNSAVEMGKFGALYRQLLRERA